MSPWAKSECFHSYLHTFMTASYTTHFSRLCLAGKWTKEQFSTPDVIWIWADDKVKRRVEKNHKWQLPASWISKTFNKNACHLWQSQAHKWMYRKIKILCFAHGINMLSKNQVSNRTFLLYLCDTTDTSQGRQKRPYIVEPLKAEKSKLSAVMITTGSHSIAMK